ncbi:MAG: glycosyltransferase family 39 protein [Candidatus Kaiserbacteria bacterium]|nr:glycosyltransferase family 39 protein [Candidatus Kaiserbacteria bacterium]
MTAAHSFYKNYKIEILIFILAIIARCLYFGLSVQAYQGDFIGAVRGADGYYVISQNIIQGHGFSGSITSPYTPDSFRPPIQSYFLASSYTMVGSYWLAILLLLLAGSLVPIIAMHITKFIFESRFIIVGTGVVLALEPVSILYSTLFYSETLFMLFFTLAIYYLFSYVRKEVWYHGIFAAALLGIATLTKTVSLYLPVLIVIVFLFHFRNELVKKRVIAAGAFILIFLLVLSPWFYRNYRVSNTFGFTSEEGVTLYTVLIPSMFAVENGTTWQQEYDAWTKNGVKGPNSATVDLNSLYIRESIPILLAHPWPLFVLCMNTAVAFFTHDGMFDVIKHVGARPDRLLGQPALFLLFSDPMKLLGFVWYYATTPTILVLLMRVVWFIVTILFFLGAVLILQKQKFTFYPMMAFVTVLYFLLITLTIGLTVNSRYRLPIEFLIIPFALYGLMYIKTVWQRFR